MTSADSMGTLRRRTSEKWTTHPKDVLPMFVAEMDFPLAPAIREGLLDAVKNETPGTAGDRPSGEGWVTRCHVGDG